MELFEVLEKKLEQVLDHYQALKTVNAKLEKQLEDKGQALQEAKETLERMTKEREVVRSRIDQLLNRLEVLGVEGQEK